MSGPFPPISDQPQGATVKRLFLCRHGETAANASGVLQGSGIDNPLNEKGVFQATCLRNQLKDIHFDIIVTSKLIRAHQTAKIVAEYHPNTEIIQIEDFAEISWGVWEGAASPNLPSLLSSWEGGDYNGKAPSGESPIDVEARSVPALYKLVLERPEKVFLFVLHGRLLRIMLSSMLFRSLDFMSEFTHHNTCINLVDTIIESDPEKFSDTPLIDKFKLFNSEKKVLELDDNVHLTQVNAAQHHQKAVSKIGKPAISTSRFQHPRMLKFIPVLLDDRRHLPSENSG
ncbi:histidine phosphatase superfamily [Globomyces pollinis-pini]|nr:histidine phosphatase superfamily [Globomyces pollinis-pini]